MTAEILNCDFLNCQYRGVYGLAHSSSAGQPAAGSATLTLQIHNCVFDSTGSGCTLLAQYTGFPDPGNAYLDAHVSGNIFKNLSGTALSLEENHNNLGGTNVSRPEFLNNTVMDANGGVDALYPYFGPIIRNNLFMRTSNAVRKVTVVSGIVDIGFNCFFSNAVNFAGGYPSEYGMLAQENHNGDPCDAFFNIFLDPRLLDTNRFLLSNFSPCIDAGDPAISDVCFNFSHGTAISDIGAYGGPDACAWLNHGFAPVITAPLQDVASCAGGSAVFTVRADGSEPLTYRWYFNGTNQLAAETNAQLSLHDLQASQAGLYSVMVSNTFGIAASGPARLLVSDACVDIGLYAGLSITGMVGRTYTVECATNLNAANWTSVATNTLSQPRWLFIDTNTPFDVKKFFRVRLQP